MVDDHVPSDTVAPSDASRATNDSGRSDSDRAGDGLGTTSGGSDLETAVRETDPEIAVRGGEPAARCPYCRQPFHAERFETLHRGLEHPSQLSTRERAAFERASLEEGADIRWFRLQAIGTLLLLYFCMLFLYAIVT